MRGFLAGLAALAIVVTAAGAATAENVDLQYTLKIDRPETGVGYVTMRISGLGGNGFSLVRASGLGEGWFDEVRATDGAGKVLAVVGVEGGYYVTTEGGDKAVVTYTIKPGEVSGGGHIGLICGDYAALDGSMVFLAPGEEQEIKSAEFEGQITPAGWTGVLDWPVSGGKARPDEAVAPVRLQLEKSLICYGDFATETKKFGANEVRVHCLKSYPAEEREKLAAALFKIYGRVYEMLKCDTGLTYNAVCLPAAPDGLPVVAGAWADGQALTLAGTFKAIDAAHYTQYFARYIADGYFAQPPFGVRLKPEDEWVYPAFLKYAEGLGVITAGKMDENVFYAQIYGDYAAEAQADDSSVDIPAAEMSTRSQAAREFVQQTKAVILMMRLDFEMRNATDNAKNVEDLIGTLYAKGRNWGEPVSVFDAVGDITGANFADFQARFVKQRNILLPTWPAFIEKMSAEKAAEPGEAAAQVDGAPIYQREVDSMVDDMLSQGIIAEKPELAKTALTTLINEKLMDEQLAVYKMNVVPEAFWRLRLVLPGRIASIVITAKRQALKDVLYSDWLLRAKHAAKVEIKEAREKPGAAVPTGSAAPTGQPLR
jgi:hypothetical protein